MLLKVFYTFFKKDLGEFLCSLYILQMTTKNEQKRAKNELHCLCCNFTTYKKNNFERHIMTSKHQRLQNTTIKEQK